MWHSWWGGWWVVLPPVLLAVVGVVVWFIVTIGGTLTSPPMGPDLEGSAGRILAERYARGEIGDDEYRHRRDMLRGAAATARKRGTSTEGPSPSV